MQVEMQEWWHQLPFGIADFLEWIKMTEERCLYEEKDQCEDEGEGRLPAGVATGPPFP